MPDQQANLLIIDDTDDMRFAIKRIFERCGCQVFDAPDATTALTVLANQPIDLIVSDIYLPSQAEGEAIISAARRQYPHIPLVVMSCAMDSQTRRQYKQLGASDCLQKPFFRDRCELLLASHISPLKRAA